ncbi:DUF3014 domain-containing protein [Alkalimonas sp.]|uniref:DUF3014 domain-containing protein n=1 Tax=Alkalimonas sp. TaxID=1872453 RepID=UPI00263A7C7A|nr:DUF3014 domain-containing protein [Alkalimonas sp.]MCC5824918.1 DUF3014 domain-containing protein [Alkalimonas sp.]
MTERESSEASAPGQQLYYLGLAAVVMVLLIAGWLLFRSDSPEPEPVQPLPQAELTELPDAEPFVPDPVALEPVPELPVEPLTGDLPVDAMPELAEAEPEPEPEPALPALNDSDAEVRQSLLQLPWQPGLAGLFVREDMLRRLVVLTDNISRGQISSDHLVLETPDQPFAVRQQGEQLSLDPAGFSRYEPYLTLLESVPVPAQVALLRHYQPLLDEAFAELGYPDKPFEYRLLQAIDYLLAQPVMDGVFELELPSVMYHFSEPHLEAMSDVQKQLIRIGPDNQRRLNQHLTKLRLALQE